MLACLLVSFELSAQDAAQPAPAPEPEPERLPPITELIAERQGLQDFLYDVGDIDTEGFLIDPRTQMAALRDQLQPISQSVADDGLRDLSLDALLDLETDLRTEVSELEQLGETLQTRAALRDDQLDTLASQRVRWEMLVAAAESRDAPPAVLEVVSDATATLDQAEQRLKADRDAVLQTLTDVSSLSLDATALSREIRNRRQNLETAAQRAAGLPLWSPELALSAGMLRDAVSAAKGYYESVRFYLADNGIRVLVLFLGVGVAALWLLKAGGSRVQEFLTYANRSTRATAVFEKPSSAALLIALLGIYFLVPPAPVAYLDLVLALLPLPAAALATTVYAKPLRLSVYMLAAALCILALRPFIDPLPLVVRIVLFVQTLAVAAAFYVDLRRGNWALALPRADPKRLGLGVRLACLLLLFIVVIDVIGFVGAASMLRTLVLGGLGYALIFAALTYVMRGLVLASLQVRPLSDLAIVKHRPWVIIHFLRRFIDALAFVGWLTSTLALSGLRSRAWDWATGVLGIEMTVGAVTIQLSSLVTGIVVLLSTWYLSRFLRFVVESRSAESASVATGLSFAISKVVGYVIIVLGFIFALAAMGFDITRVTVLAGALGVGIGLGLQNIANNFISGIILLFERPIQVNDIAKVEDTIGTVKEVGIRSTVLQTFDGAEVIVPNADLIAKTVLNWTKSNRRRRAEIDVGVAYGTEPKQVLDILNTVARGHDDVLDDPEPLATFTGFGDSSLNFRLYVWLSDLSSMLETPSVLRQEILEKLEEEGIEIPFPQRDIRVTMAAAGHEHQAGPAVLPGAAETSR